MDYAGPFEGRMIFIIVDVHSKYIDAHVVSSATTSATITKLRQTFAVLVLPITIVSDNGSCFTSDQFEQFCRANGIKHVNCSPYHPSSNGLAERAVQTAKAGLKKTTGNLEGRLCNFLTRYRMTPQSTTGHTPADFVLKTPPRSRLDLLRPSIQNSVIQKQANDKQRHDAHAAERTFRGGHTVWAMNFQGKPKWIATVVENQLGPLTFVVRLKDGRTWKRHQDHLRERRPNENDEFRKQQKLPDAEMPPPPDIEARSRQPEMTYSNSDTLTTVPTLEHTQTPVSVSVSTAPSPTVVRRSTRVSKPSDKLKL